MWSYLETERNFCPLFLGGIFVVVYLISQLCDPTDCSPPGSSVHGISQARILEWVAISFSGDLPDPGTEHAFPGLQVDSQPSEPPGKPIWLDVIICFLKRFGILSLNH